MEMREAVDAYGGDVVMYRGDISRLGYAIVSDYLEARTSGHTKICFILMTYGGDPDAAFRIARALQHHYDHIDILVPDICKSAGTLLCVGATRLIFGDRGELGPLDIQLSKPDELGESTSGLNILQALSAMQARMLHAFREYFVEIRAGSWLRTRISADLAAQLAGAFVGPLAAKIDPMTLGEHQRAMQIALDYGLRLDETAKNLHPSALDLLIGDYPSHSFVIDRREARKLFRVVEAPVDALKVFYDFARASEHLIAMSNGATVFDIAGDPTNMSAKEDENERTNLLSIEQDPKATGGENSRG